MKKRSEDPPDWHAQREKIIGLGETSLRKSYYPELREKIAELERINTELRSAYEQLSASEEELHQNYDELSFREHELRESEEKYRNLIENTFDGVIIHQGRHIVYANRTAAKMLGVPGTESLVGRSIFSIIHKDFHEIARERAQASLSRIQLPRHEILVRDDGTVFDVDIVALPTTWNHEPAAQVAFRDITAQKRAEDALHESEQRYRTLIETTDTGFLIMDPGGNVMDANRKYLELSGHSRLDEILGHNVLEWTAGDEQERNIRALARCMDEGVLRNFETEYIDAAGTITPVEINAAMVMYETTSRILALCRDITERKKSERTLRESEMFYRAIFNTTGSASIIIDGDGTIVHANEGFARLSGYSAEDLEGRHRWTEFVQPEDLRRIKIYLSEGRLKAGSVPQTYEFGFVTRQGRVRHCILYVATIPDTTLSIASIVDITDRVIAEQELISAKRHLEAIYEGSPDLIIVHAADGRIIDMNENALAAYGMSREELIASSFDTRLIGGYTVDMAMERIRAALENGQAEFEWFAKRKDGREFPVEIRLRRIETVNERGEPEPRVLAIVRDITERRMSERALELARKKLGLLNTVIFQDIQSTVFALSAYIQLATSNRDEDKARTYADKEILLINKIVSSLNFTKNYQDLGLHPPRWQNVNQVFLYAISHLDSLKIARHIEVPDLEIYADPLLEKVFFNLVENSFIHGQRVTDISLYYTEADDGIHLILSDNGVGIPAANKARIFDQGSGKNAGLGLFLVREILSITGITVSETGEEGNGARFEMLVPKNAYRFRKSAAEA